MSSRLDSKPQIWTLAADLGLATSESPSRTILQFVGSRIRRIARKFHATSLNDLLIATAGEVETTFEEIHSDHDRASQTGRVGTAVCLSNRLQGRQGLPELLFEMARAGAFAHTYAPNAF